MATIENSRHLPRGIEVLVRKASVDPAFRDVLLDDRELAAELIGLELAPEETAMLKAVPCDQLETIIGKTTVPRKDRVIFMGRVAAAMLVALGALTLASCEKIRATKGDRADRPPEKKKADKSDDETGARK